MVVSDAVATGEEALEPALVTVPAEEYSTLLPDGAEFTVENSVRAGRYMASSAALGAAHELLYESPLVAWPLAPEALSMPELRDRGIRCVSWCEGCFAYLADDDRPVRRRLVGKRPAPAPGMFCTACRERRPELADLFSSELLARWRRWQTARSPNSKVGLEAFARCAAHVAVTAARLRAATPGLGAGAALRAALRPFERLVAPPEGHFVALDGTSAAEIAAELRASQPFACGVAAAIGCPLEAASLLSEDTIGAIAGRLVLNAVGIEVHGAGLGGTSLPTVGVFVLLSTMNHSCSPSVEVVTGPSMEVCLRTLRPVEQGEALTISYVPLDWSREQRRKRLRHWFFDCDCYRCESEAKVVAALAG